MYRTELLNFLVRQRNYKRYLEIGVRREKDNFQQVSCLHKVGVDFKAGTVLHCPSDDFFARNRQAYDLIFIDGVHTEEQTLRDIGNALRCLSKGGIAVLHDCMPPDEWHQRGPEEFREGENWNGAVWKAALRYFNRAKYKCTLVDTDWGCGIIDTARAQKPLNLKLPDALDYKLHYPWLLEYRTGVAGFLREHVSVFYHLACMGNWKEVFREQMSMLRQSGFRRVELTLLGGDEGLQTVRSVGSELELDINLVFQAPDFSQFEKPAMLAIQEYARQHDGYVLYLHSKGVSNPADGTKAKWRRLMMRELVEKWEHCVLQLPRYDIIGVNWRDMPPTSHFCGNFWYASTRYLRKLPDFGHYFDHPRYHIWDAVHNKRLGCEFWIGSAREKPRLLSLAYRNVDFCNPGFWANKR
ncbi:MAG: class I SAM-dependent methyltransferase [Lewinellaceae bacterium]|nr:class I SAM-dependent methyltransferase [Lewinellaceae bacterium]